MTTLPVKLYHPLFLIGFVCTLFSCANLWAQEDLTLPGHYVVEENTVEEYGNVELNNKDSKLEVKGTLIVYGNLKMSGNQAELILRKDSRLIIYGNFIASNQVNLNLTGYLIIHGDFEKGGSSGQDDITIVGGNIYIFGNVLNWGDEFKTCGDYEGNTGAVNSEECDYGTEDDYEENYEDLPDELKEDCFGFTPLQNSSVHCENETVTFSVENLTNVGYEWQEKVSGGEWTAMGNNSSSLTLENLTPEMTGNRYRVKAQAEEGYEGNCSIAISNAVTLTVMPQNFEITEITGPLKVCAGEQVIYSIAAVEYADFYEWYLPEDWTIVEGEGSEKVTVIPNGNSGEVKVSVTNLCSTTKENIISVKAEVLGVWTGEVSSAWNNPSNWGCGIRPDSSTDVLVPSEAPFFPVIPSGGQGMVKNLEITVGASLQISGRLNIAGKLNNLGNFDVVQGSVKLNGESPQVIPQGTFSDNRVRELVIENPLGASLEGLLEVSDLVRLIQGNFEISSAGELVLLSDEIQTAIIDGAGNGDIIGKVTMQRYLDPAFGYKYISSPFQATKVGDFKDYVVLTAVFPNFYVYDENREHEWMQDEGNVRSDASGWKSYTEPENLLNIMQGYAINLGPSLAEDVASDVVDYVADDVAKISISGTVNNGDQEIDLYNHNKKYTNGFNLVGNPYPSPIDWDMVDRSGTNIDGAIHFFTASDHYTGTYVSYIPGGLTSDGSDGEGSSIIPSMQGFFVHVSDSDSDTETFPIKGTLKLTNAVRVNNFEQGFYKRSQNSIALLRISAQFQGEKKNDPTVIYFDPTANATFDPALDALKMMNTDPRVPNLYSLSPGKKEMSINAVPLSGGEEETRFPLGIRTEKSGRMKIQLKDFENIPAGYHLYLIDKHQRRTQNLNRKAEYSFNIKQGKEDSRFELLLTTELLQDEAVAFQEIFSVRTSNGTLRVKLNLDPQQNAVVRVYSIFGQLLETKRGQAKELLEMRGVKNSGVHVVTVDVGGEKYSKKIVIN